MSGIYDLENQFIIRFPKDVAAKLREAFADNKDIPIEIEPKLGDTFEFDIKIPQLQFQDKGTLVDLPTITESYKSRDYINLYKSNDISQMIWVGMDKCKETLTRTVQMEDDIKKVICDSGLTPPTYNISKDFFRKQPNISIPEIQRVEKELDVIQKEFMQQDDSQDDGDRRRGSKKQTSSDMMFQ